jgi:glycosyltransferase involved in cell wall biosynthesis
MKTAAMRSEIIANLVTTIIPVYNRPRLLRRAVESVLAQTYRPIEIIIVDDGSTDDTPEQARALAAQCPEIVRVVSQENRGPGGARETGRQIARGEFIQYLDSDDFLLPQKFELQVAGLQAHPECGVSYGKTRHEALPPDRPWKGTGEKVDFMFPAFLRERIWSTPTPLYRRTVVDRAGPWTTLRREEDWEYDCRIAALATRLHWSEDWVAEIGIDPQHGLSGRWANRPDLLRDRARAHALIYAHARRAGIDESAPEMQHYSRELFLLARQCASKGLVDEARQLFALAQEAAGAERAEGADFRLYEIASRFLGWKAVGKLACWSDRFRGTGQ